MDPARWAPAVSSAGLPSRWRAGGGPATQAGRRVRPGGAVVAGRLAEVADLLPGSVSDSMVESLQVDPPYGTSQLKEVSYVCRQFA